MSKGKPILVQINSAVNFSSTGKIVEQLGVTARAEGWETYVAHGARYVRASELQDMHIENKMSEHLHVMISQAFDAHGLGSRFSTRKLVQEIERIKPDVIHLHNIHGYYLNYPILFKSLGEINIPVVWTFHDCWPMTGHCAYFDLANCEKWKNGCYECPLIKQYPAAIYDSSKSNWERKKKYFNLPQRMTIVPVSKWEEKIVKESFLANYNTKVIYSGIDLNDFKPIESNIRKELSLENKFVILGVASGWGKEGRLNGFLELRKLLDEKYVIILVGLSSTQIATMPDGIIGVSRTNNAQELAAFYTMADVFINPTMQDSFGLTSVEAQACGTPSITYRSGGSPETVSKKTGIVVERGNTIQLKEAVIEIEQALKQSSEKFSSSVCREWAVINFNKYERYNDYIELYNSLL